MLLYNGITPSFPNGDTNKFGNEETGIEAVLATLASGLTPPA